MSTQQRSAQQAMLRTLRRNEEERASILAVLNHQGGDQQPCEEQAAQGQRSFFDHLLHSYGGDEEVMLRSVAIDRTFFYSVLNIVDSVRLANRGRPGFVRAHKDKLLFLIIFLKDGTDALEKACLPAITDPSTITRNLHRCVDLFKDVLLRNTVEFKHERLDTDPLVSSVVDCTVVEIAGPDLDFGQKDEFYSGKHKKHCLKKEVIVNVRSGTAAMISKAHPGSVADIEVLKRHSQQVNQMLGRTTVLADKGYRGDPGVPNLRVVSRANAAEKQHG